MSAETGTMAVLLISIFPGTSTELNRGDSQQREGGRMDEWVSVGPILGTKSYPGITHPVGSTLCTEQLSYMLGIKCDEWRRENKKWPLLSMSLQQTGVPNRDRG